MLALRMKFWQSLMKVERTNIIIRLEEPIIQVGMSVKSKWQDFRLRITPPSTAFSAPTQSFRFPKSINVPKNGVIKLQLFPSHLYGDRAVGNEIVYKVELFHKSQSLPLDVWYWDIPYNPRKTVRVITYFAPHFELPDDFFELIECDCQDYEIKDNKLIIPNIDDGTPVTLEYKPGVNLNEITRSRYGSISTDKRQYRYWT